MIFKSILAYRLLHYYVFSLSNCAEYFFLLFLFITILKPYYLIMTSTDNLKDRSEIVKSKNQRWLEVANIKTEYNKKSPSYDRVVKFSPVETRLDREIIRNAVRSVVAIEK